MPFKYVASGQALDDVKKLEDIERFLSENLKVRWRDALSRLLDSGAITAATMKKAFQRNHGIVAFLDERAKQIIELASKPCVRGPLPLELVIAATRMYVEKKQPIYLEKQSSIR